jgi:hypothetical protein
MVDAGELEGDDMSLMFTIAEREGQPYTHRIWDLCQFLTARVLQPFFARQGVKWERHFADFIAPAAGESPFEATGTVCFRPPPMFAGQLGELERGLSDALREVGIRTAPWERQCSEDGLAVEWIRIPVVENPTARYGPPEVNMSNSAGCLVLRDLLGYRVQRGAYEFRATDVLERLGAVTDSQVVKCSSRTVRDPGVPGRLRVTQSTATAQRIHRCLDEVRRFAQWARDHDFERLRARQ